MRILGIDPGYAIVGYGTIDSIRDKIAPVNYGAIQTNAGTPLGERLLHIDVRLSELIGRDRPDAISLEKLYFSKNVTTGIAVAEARGVILLRATREKVPVFEYTPMQVKQSVVGYGKAEKHQVMEMTRMLLGLEKTPQPDDAADALALAICHFHCCGSLLGALTYKGS